jgi:trimethylamine--corrinoid protein Co-methyltransferase
MSTNLNILKAPQFRILSDDQIREIHLAALEILDHTGVWIESEEVIDLLGQAGARIRKDKRVAIPSHLVEDAILSAPKRIVLSDRDGKRKIFLENNKVYFGAMAGCPFFIDPYSGNKKPFERKDMENVVKVIDYLPNIDIVCLPGQYSDVPPTITDRIQFKDYAMNTRKPILFSPYSLDGLKDIISVSASIAGGEDKLIQSPFIVNYSEPVTPLTHVKDALDSLLFSAELNIPIVYTPMPLGGATAPATFAGILALNNAEVLSGLVISQLKKKGAPFIFGGVPTIMDMSTSILSYGAPEMSLLSAGLTEIAHFYKLPMFGTAGCTDSKMVDQQAAIESTLSCLLSILSGANLVHDVGLMDNGASISLELMVLNDEIIGMIKGLMNGIEVNQEMFALDVIDKVGPRGHFLYEDHTLKHFRKFWRPKFFHRLGYEEWVKSGKLSMGDRLNQEVRRIIETHSIEPLPKTLAQELHQMEEGWYRKVPILKSQKPLSVDS